jgi:hypothetical protein
LDNRGRSIMKEWFDGVGSKDKARVLRILDYLVWQPRSEWRRPQFDQLHGPVAQMGEIILKVIGGVQTRLVGFFDDKRMVFTIVLVVTKKEPNYLPRDWEQISIKRMIEVKANSRCADEWYP